jgi:hypothetical protein
VPSGAATITLAYNAIKLAYNAIKLFSLLTAVDHLHVSTVKLNSEIYKNENFVISLLGAENLIKKSSTQKLTYLSEYSGFDFSTCHRDRPRRQ